MLFFKRIAIFTVVFIFSCFQTLWAQDSSKVSTEDTTVISKGTIAEYPGGISALQKHVNNWLNTHIDAKCLRKIRKLPKNTFLYLSYMIEKDGSVSNVEVERGIPFKCMPELARAIKKALEWGPKWKPGTYNGEKIRLRYTQRLQLR